MTSFLWPLSPKRCVCLQKWCSLDVCFSQHSTLTLRTVGCENLRSAISPMSRTSPVGTDNHATANELTFFSILVFEMNTKLVTWIWSPWCLCTALRPPDWHLHECVQMFRNYVQAECILSSLCEIRDAARWSILLLLARALASVRAAGGARERPFKSPASSEAARDTGNCAAAAHP